MLAMHVGPWRSPAPFVPASGAGQAVACDGGFFNLTHRLRGHPLGCTDLLAHRLREQSQSGLERTLVLMGSLACQKGGPIEWVGAAHTHQPDKFS